MSSEAPNSRTVTRSRAERTSGHSPICWLLLRVPSTRPPPPPFGVSATCQGLCPLRDMTSVRPRFARVPKSSLCSVLRRSQPLDGLLRSDARRLVSSRSRVQDVTRPGVSPLCTATLPRREELPPCRWREVRSPTNRLPQTRRLDFEAFLRAESRVGSSAVRPRPRPLPSSGSLLLQVLLEPPRLIPQTRTLLTLTVRSFDDASAAAGPNGSPPALSRTETWRSRLRDRQPARAFRAFPVPAL